MLERIQGFDLQVVGAQYHQRCYSSFCLPNRPSKDIVGRPPTASVSSAMDPIFEYLEENKDQCQFSLRELSSLVDDPPSDATLKKNSKKSIAMILLLQVLLVVLQWFAFELTKFSSTHGTNTGTTTRKSNDWESLKQPLHPSPEKFLDDIEEDIPESLRIFLDDIIVKPKRKSKDTYKTKCLSIAHAIIAATRPRSF